MTDIRLSKLDHDIEISDQLMSLTNDSDGESIAQRIKIRLWTFRGEYFFNEDFGVPYFQTIFQKGVSVDEIDNIFKSTIRDTPGVIELVQYNSVYDRAKREFRLDFKVRSNSGTTTLGVTV